MSIRHLALYTFVAGLSIYAWKDWFKSLCGLILLVAVLERSDMPSNIMGIQGFNPWNVLFAIVFLAWLAHRSRDGLIWDMARHMNLLLVLYLGVVVFGTLRALFDRSHIQHLSLMSLISDQLINTIKWVLPGVLLFDGCRTRRHVVMTLSCIFAVYVLIAVQVVRYMPLAAALGDAAVLERARISLGNYMNYTAVNISAALAGVSWAILAALPLVRKRLYQVLLAGTAGVVTLGQALTGGRAGILAWGGTGVILCLLRWRRYLLLAPVAVILLPLVFPAATGRMLSGFEETSAAGEGVVDKYEVSSGRLLVWPHVIKKIGQSPFIGHGRMAMRRTGLTSQMTQMGYSRFGHPHNMYLETLLDNGILGSLPILLFWGVVVVYSARLFRSDNRLYSVVGGLTLALTLAQLIAGMGAQHFYPRSVTLGWWASTFLMLRVHVEEKRAREILQPESVVGMQLAIGQQEVACALGEQVTWR